MLYNSTEYNINVITSLLKDLTRKKKFKKLDIV